MQSGGVDWASSLAIGFNNHGIYINTSDRPQGKVGGGAERESLMEELRRKLMDYRDPESGERPVASVLWEELYSGPRTKWAPDLMVEMVKGWTTKPSSAARASSLSP